MAALCTALAASAGPLRDRLEARRAARLEENAEAKPTENTSSTQAIRGPELPPNAFVLRNEHYGRHSKQVLDVYLPDKTTPVAGVVFMVHGGGWRTGDKLHGNVVNHKVQRWLSRHLAVISIDYRLLPQAPVSTQAEDVRLALAYAQKQANHWGLPPDRFVLVGHSAGAHLVALVSSNPQPAQAMGALPWLGTVVLDSAVMNVPAYMGHRHVPLYDDAFGTDPTYWTQNSPWHQLTPAMPPVLLACSTKRADHPCDQAQAFAAKAQTLGVRAEVLPQPLSHSEMNDKLGEPGPYTDAVERFLASLHPSLAQVLR